VHRRTSLRYWFNAAAPTPEAQLDYLNRLPKLTEDGLKALIHGMKFPDAYKPVVAPAYIPIASLPGQREFRILEHVRTTRKDSRNWWAKCPCCTLAGRDRTGDNLSIQIRDSRFYKCWAGCTKDEIRAALGRPIRMKQAA
jgi:hypothetical protein